MNTNPVLKNIERRLMAITEAEMNAVSLPARAPNATIVAERVCMRIWRLRTLKEMVERECQLLAERNTPEWTLKDALRGIIGQTLDLEVWQTYSMLIGKEYTFYSDRSIGPQETNDTVSAMPVVGLAEIWSTYVPPPPTLQ